MDKSGIFICEKCATGYKNAEGDNVAASKATNCDANSCGSDASGNKGPINCNAGAVSGTTGNCDCDCTN